MRKAWVLTLIIGLWMVGGPAGADGPSGSTECHIQDDDCDGTIDEDTGTMADNDDGDGQFDEDSVDGIDNDLDGQIDEDPADDDGDGLVDEDPPGNAVADPGGNQVQCGDGTAVGPAGEVYADPSRGAEVCADDGSSLPIDGRIVVDAEEGYVAIDGDNDNPGASNGYARVDSDGVHCGDDTSNQDSGADQSGNDESDCG
jgi:hypothetical protein